MSSSSNPADTFRNEAAELLVQLEEALLDMEAASDASCAVDQVFRALHTIKGSGAMFGFTAVAEFTHHLENAFDEVRNNRRPVTNELVSLTLASLDHIRRLIDAPETADAAVGQGLLASLRDINQASGGTAAPAPEPDAAATWVISFRPGREVLSFGTNPLLLLNELRGLGECAVTALTDRVPPMEDLDPHDCHLGWEITLTTDRPRSAIEDVFLFVVDESELSIERLGEADTEEFQRDDATPAPLASEPANAQREQAPEQPRGVPRGGQGATVRVQAERLDSLMDQVGELVIAQARLRQIAAASDDIVLRSIAEEIERLANDLRDTTMSIRMLPIGTLFGRFRRLVRDLANDLGKDVALTMVGEETELDKTVIESLNDPLVHLIRNAMDHGIETAEERQRRGKPPQGRMHLSAVHSGAQVLITVSDDGRGLDREAVRAKAEERGLVAPGAEISDAELYGFIFHPGFSTAKSVSSLSGRGVGMDVVKQTIDGLRGSIEVASTPGMGTRVTLKLPLTLAIIDGLLVRVEQGFHVLPLAAVEEVVDLSAQMDVQSRGRSFLNIRGDIVPFVRLRELFGCHGRPDTYQKVVIVTSGELRVGLVVDQVIGQYQTVIKSLSKLLDDVSGFSGATILGDGSVALILDVPHLIDFAQEREHSLKAS